MSQASDTSGAPESSTRTQTTVSADDDTLAVELTILKVKTGERLWQIDVNTDRGLIATAKSQLKVISHFHR
jgi:hypothetical protein